MKNTLNKFVQQISHSSQQVNGTVNIMIPEMVEDMTDEQAIQDIELMHQYEEYMESWTRVIKDTLLQKSIQEPDTHKTSLNEIEFWRNRHAILSTLQQQLSHEFVATCFRRLDKYLVDNHTTVYEYDVQYKELTRLLGESKEYVKFLSTLERQFKNLATEGLSGVEETLKSLMNGLRLVWTISRHYQQDKKMQKLISTVSYEIADKVESQIKIRELFQLNDSQYYHKQLEETKETIMQGQRILTEWKDLFFKTKLQIEDEQGVERWDFQPTAITEHIKHMIDILDGLVNVTDILKRFLIFLGPNLKAVTGNSKDIDGLVAKVKQLVVPFQNSQYNFFQHSHKHHWKTIYNDFNHDQNEIEQQTIQLINVTFQDLRSAEGAFELLQNFKNIQTLEAISDRLQKKYSDVLDQYGNELQKNRKIFEEGQNKQIFSKNKPQVAGAISWAKAIMQRVKGPIIKFQTKADTLDPQLFGDIRKQYRDLAAQLDKYQNEKFKEWSDRITERAMQFLKQKILIQKKDAKGNKVFEVNFSEEFKILIKEAKHLEKMGKPISKTIVNISLQENTYYENIDDLNRMLREYNDAVTNLSEIEKKLFENKIKELNYKLEQQLESCNLCSLGINTFIQNYTNEINTFKDLKRNVSKSAQMIEDVVVNIEKGELLRDFDFDKNGKKQGSLLSLIDFYNYFQEQLKRQFGELVEQYRQVNEQFLKSIEGFIEMKNTRASINMKEYYYYWERRVYNALIKMVLRGIIKFKYLIQHPTSKQTPLFLISAEYEYPRVNFYPNWTETSDHVMKICKNMMNECSQFWRWKDGTCIFCDTVKGNNDEQVQQYNFQDPIIKNPMIVKQKLQLQYIQIYAQKKVMFYENMMDDDKKKKLFDNTGKINIDKMIEKKPSIHLLEQKIQQYKQMMNEYDEMPRERNAFYVQIYFGKVIEALQRQAKEWLNKYGKVLSSMGEKEYQVILEEIEEYRLMLKNDPNNIVDLKKMLHNIADIKNKSMDMEFRLSDLTEKFRILEMYNLKVEKDKLQDAREIEVKWKKLVRDAKVKDYKLNNVKAHFAKETQDDVVQFKDQLQDYYDQYIKSGPGSDEVDLDQGLELLEVYKQKTQELNEKKEELVLAEKLFNLDISNFPKLVAIEEENKKLSVLYKEYKLVKGTIQEWSQHLWNKLDPDQLMQEANTFDKMRKKLAKTYDSNSVFQKLSKRILDFKNSIPLIQKLKGSNITESHWGKLMKETGLILTLNLKTITLEQVFKMNLQDFPDKVDDICNEAQQEDLNEKEISKIEQSWKGKVFELYKHNKGEGVMLIRISEDVKVDLDDHLLNLQTVAGSRFIKSLITRVKLWETNLNRIQEVIEVWLMVQKKWTYLEGIFTGSEDIRQQLKDETKKFDKNDKQFKKIMEQTQKNPIIISCCVMNENRLSELKTLSDQLDQRQKSLSDYLDTKRNFFARFYFLSDDDLLSILGSSEISAVQPHMLKLYDNCKELRVKGGRQVIGMESDEGEQFTLREQIKAEKPVEEWMTKVETEMMVSLKKITKEQVFHYSKTDRQQWVMENLSMTAIIGTQIWWTWRVEDVFHRVKDGNKHAMKQEAIKQTKDLNQLIDLIRGDIDPLNRSKINTLIITDVHARDIVDRFVRDSILDEREFEWESQLRFYWQLEENDIRVRQCTGVFTYGYEYQGINGRLVITPLTDRCVMTLTTALTFRLGGAPAGPAGTGKTETVKDLAKSLAIRCCVTNCGEGLDYKAMGTNFSGLVQTGFWGCFDEFNRINPAVLSVVAVQIRQIQDALAKYPEKKTLELLKKELRVVPTVGIFVTMNPGYEGRSDLPDNLKALFRPVTMVVPNLEMICEIMLMSEGFQSARLLALKMTVLYKLAKEQLSKQYHYDFQLRALKSVLVMAGKLKRDNKETMEDLVLMRALRDMNMPKFVYEDEPLFLGLISDLFPSMDITRVPYEKYDLIAKIIENNNLQLIPAQINKMVQLYETMLTRHTTMVVGPTGAGKSTVIDLYRQVDNVQVFYINPKSITVAELYGDMDANREWKDGLLSKTFRIANTNSTTSEQNKRWILFDGDVDAKWVENMNSVMDDNRLLTLINDRIRLEKYCSLLFEVADLQYASPATISRCGMVYVDPKLLGYLGYFEKWMSKWTKDKNKDQYEVLIENLVEKFNNYVPPLINFILEGQYEEEITKPLEFIVVRTDLNLVTQLCKLIDSLVKTPETYQDPDQIEHMLVFCLVWSFGISLKTESRVRFEEILRRINGGRGLPSTNLFENFYDFNKTKVWMPWEKMVLNYQPPEDGKFSKILVPTVDTTRFSYMLDLFVQSEQPLIFAGDSGTAKSVIIQNYLASLSNDKYMKLNINFSSRTTSHDLQQIIEDNIDRRSGRIYGPKIPGKKLITFIDDMHMPNVDRYGTQQPIALLKFLIEKKYIYERTGALDVINIRDIQFVGAMLPPGGGNNMVDPRYLSLFGVFCIMFPSRENVERIYNCIIKSHLQPFDQVLQDQSNKFTEMTMKLYNQVVLLLPRTPTKFHYIFNLRDLSRVYEGLCRSTPEMFGTPETMARLWRNECQRVFCDKLIIQEDRDLINVQIGQLVNEYFSEKQEMILQEPLIIGDYMMSDPSEPDHIDPKIYQECGDFNDVQKKFDTLIASYNDEDEYKEMNLVLFKDALEHLTKIHRIIRFPRGHALLVGFGGSGKQSLTRLATYTAGYGIFSINLQRGYNEKEFREDLTRLYEQLCKKPTTFLFTDSHIQEEGFLELVNNMLTIGMVPALFDEEGKKQMIDIVRDEAKKLGVPEGKDDLWNYFLEKVKDNLHIVLAMSPAGDSLRIRCRNFPGLVSSTSIDWFFQWPEEALASVATFYLQEEDLPAEIRDPITQHIVLVHQSVQEYSKEFEAKLKRKNFSTPKNYLDFLSNYRKLLGFNRNQIQEIVHRYTVGLKKLEDAAVNVSEMSEELKIKQVQVNQEKEQVEILIEDIKHKSEITEKHTEKAVIKKQDLDVKNQEIKIKKAEADEILENAIPILEKAKAALNNIQSKELSLLKAMPNPPDAVKYVGQMVLVLKPKGQEDDKDGWNGVKIMFGNPSSFVELLKNYGQRMKYLKGHQVEKVNKIRETQSKDLDKIDAINSSAAALFTWVTSTVNYYEVYKKVEPMQQKVDEMSALKEVLENDLTETNELLDRLQTELQGLQDNKSIKQKRLDELTNEAESMKSKLNAATKLITGLSREQKRWAEDTITLEENKVKLLGDCLLCSSFLSYVGPFDYFFRKKMVYDHWYNDIKDKLVPLSENFHIDNLLTTDVEKSKWASEGLPSDELSIQNGILTNRANRWPLCIDPQLQAVNWIKKKEDKEMKVLNINDGPGVFIKYLETAIRHGKSVLFENIDEELDPTLDPILEKSFNYKLGQKFLKLGDNDVDYNENFRMFFTTKLPNPKYSPEIMGKSMVINYTVTLQGLRDQLLNVVVGFERPDKEKQRLQLIVDMSNFKTQLKEAEDQLLSSLSNAQGSLLENTELIETLEKTKNKSREIAEAIAEGEITQQDIEQARQSYSPVAKRGAILFFSMVGLSVISEMYEYSLTAFLQVFNMSLKDARKDSILENRLRSIIDKLTLNVYDYTCLGIFEVHKLMFSFQMTLAIQEGEDLLNKEQLNFFLKGNTSLEDPTEEKPYLWVSQSGWKDMQKIESVGDEFKGIMEDLHSNGHEWKQWYDTEKPETEELPGKFSKLNSFEILIILRLFRPDRIINGVKKFIIEQNRNNSHFVKAPSINYMKIFQQSSEKSPIVFILSPGADPLSDVAALAEEVGFTGNKFKYFSLGQGMEKEASQLVETSATRGHWLMLMNCHLLIKWLKNSLEKSLEKFDKPHKDFRLWLTTQSDPNFPLGLLQKSLKIVTEPPDGLQLNCQAMLTKLSDEQLNDCPHYAFKPLVYVVTFFHAIVLDRRKYGKIGWNVNYDFNESDFKISFKLLGMYLRKAYDNQDKVIPWASLKSLIGDAMYGGRVTDDNDRRVLLTYLDEYMGDFLFDANTPFMFSCGTGDVKYGMPDELTQEGILNHISQMPMINSPDVFGLHPNAEITYFTNSAKNMWDNIIAMRSSSTAGGGEGGISKDEYIQKTAEGIQERIPESYDINFLRKDADNDMTPSKIVLFQELERINKLMEKITSSLFDLKRALVGEIGMSSELDELSLSLLNGFLPASWRRLAPQTEKKLGSWMSHLTKRIQQYNDWINIAEPKVMWLSGLHIPESYLTGLVQTTCRRKKWALDKSTLYTQVTKFIDQKEILKKPEDGCYIIGLYLEGAGWDFQRALLKRQNPKELIINMPIIQIVPVEAKKLKLKNNLKTPIYVTQNRKNAMGFGQVSEADLTTDEHDSLWILQGVCLTLNVDF